MARFYLDDCADSKELLRLLRAHGHDVERPSDAGIKGEDDQVHFAHVRQAGRILMTKDPGDFKRLHDGNRSHSGIFAIYQNNRPGDMSDADVARAVENVIALNQPVAGQFISLNYYNDAAPESAPGGR